MYKVYYYFLINGDWQNDGHDALDRLPEKDDIMYVKGTAYRVLNIDENDDDDSYDVFLD